MKSLTRMGQVGGLPRIAAFLDVENLMEPFRQAGRLTDGVGEVARILSETKAVGTLVLAEAVAHFHLCEEAGFELQLCGLRLFRHGGGKDRADRELSSRVAFNLPRSCRRVVIGSGDHSFVEVAQQLKAAGVWVHVVAVEGCLSHELRSVASSIELIPHPYELQEAA